MTNRYSSAYSTARLVIVIGRIFSVLGIIAGLLVMIVGFSSGVRTASVLYWAIAEIMLGALVGIIISAQGQMMLAVLDTAINTSPFLSTQQKAQAIGVTLTASGASKGDDLRRAPIQRDVVAGR